MSFRTYEYVLCVFLLSGRYPLHSSAISIPARSIALFLRRFTGVTRQKRIHCALTNRREPTGTPTITGSLLHCTLTTLCGDGYDMSKKKSLVPVDVQYRP
jgi:hypothetical protein